MVSIVSINCKFGATEVARQGSLKNTLVFNFYGGIYYYTFLVLSARRECMSQSQTPNIFFFFFFRNHKHQTKLSRNVRFLMISAWSESQNLP